MHANISRLAWVAVLISALGTYAAAFWLRLQEWPSWQEVEYRLGSEMLLATHDAYHWVAGAEGFEFGVGHPMSELLRISALLAGTEPAAVAFWLPPVLASLLAVLVLLWAWSLKSLPSGFCAGILASLAPGFLARTMLGYADTDLVTLVLPLLIALVPAYWCMRFLQHPLVFPAAYLSRRIEAWQIAPESHWLCRIRIWLHSFFSWLLCILALPEHKKSALFAPIWTILLGASGILSCWAQDWHSLFPYLIRFNVALLGILAYCCACQGERNAALLAALCYALPALGGSAGLLFPFGLCLAVSCKYLRLSVHLRKTPVLGIFWIFACLLLFDQTVLSTMLHHVQAYMKPDAVFAVQAVDALQFPSITRSIIEIQDLSLSEMRLYFHPWPGMAMIGLGGFVLLLCARSGAFFLLPLLALALLSAKMGGRMVMFGAPVVALGLTLPFDWLASFFADLHMRCRIILIAVLPAALFCVIYHGEILQYWDDLDSLTPLVIAGIAVLLLSVPVQNFFPSIPHLLCRGSAALLILVLVAPPLTDLIPVMTEGPIINRRHADALRAMRSATPQDAMIWLWWDWGYAAHHFARRKTIANGAEHGGPSLLLPSAVFATDDPVYARQIIKYTAEKGNIPGNVFQNMDARKAAELMANLKKSNTPLIHAPGRQYLVVAFDMLDLGFWISTFGNWNFLQHEGKGYAISIVPQALAYRLDKGEVVMKSTNVMVPAASIDVFDDSGMVHRDYLAPPEYLPDNEAIHTWRENTEKRRNVHFLFNRVTGEKLVVDDRMYNTLMIQLLVCKPGDARFAPYFRLIYDNTFCRVYEVL